MSKEFEILYERPEERAELSARLQSENRVDEIITRQRVLEKLAQVQSREVALYKALQFYADRSNYDQCHILEKTGEPWSYIEADNGDHANAALAHFDAISLEILKQETAAGKFTPKS